LAELDVGAVPALLAGLLLTSALDLGYNGVDRRKFRWGARLKSGLMFKIFIDADACPVKAEIFKVAARYGVPVIVVSNAPIQVPKSNRIKAIVVGEGLDVADDWIAHRIKANDIVITEDIPLAGRCLEKFAKAIGTRGSVYTETSITSSLASRELLSQLREQGLVTGGPSPFEEKDRSRFLQRLDQTIQAVKKILRTESTAATIEEEAKSEAPGDA